MTSFDRKSSGVENAENIDKPNLRNVRGDIQMAASTGKLSEEWPALCASSSGLSYHPDTDIKVHPINVGYAR